MAMASISSVTPVAVFFLLTAVVAVLAQETNDPFSSENYEATFRKLAQCSVPSEDMFRRFFDQRTQQVVPSDFDNFCRPPSQSDQHAFMCRYYNQIIDNYFGQYCVEDRNGLNKFPQPQWQVFDSDKQQPCLYLTENLQFENQDKQLQRVFQNMNECEAVCPGRNKFCLSFAFALQVFQTAGKLPEPQSGATDAHTGSEVQDDQNPNEIPARGADNPQDQGTQALSSPNGASGEGTGLDIINHPLAGDGTGGQGLNPSDIPPGAGGAGNEAGTGLQLPAVVDGDGSGDIHGNPADALKPAEGEEKTSGHDSSPYGALANDKNQGGGLPEGEGSREGVEGQELEDSKKTPVPQTSGKTLALNGTGTTTTGTQGVTNTSDTEKTSVPQTSGKTLAQKATGTTTTGTQRVTNTSGDSDQRPFNPEEPIGSASEDSYSDTEESDSPDFPPAPAVPGNDQIPPPGGQDHVPDDHGQDNYQPPVKIEQPPEQYRNLEREKELRLLEEESSSSHFLAYTLTAIILIMVTYILYHNKQKIVAIIVEGKSSNGRRRRYNQNAIYTTLKAEET